MEILPFEYRDGAGTRGCRARPWGAHSSSLQHDTITLTSLMLAEVESFQYMEAVWSCELRVKPICVLLMTSWRSATQLNPLHHSPLCSS